MVQKVHGAASSGQFLTGGLNFYKVRTLLDIRPNGDLSSTVQQRFEKLTEIISTRAQPVIHGSVVVSTEAKASITDLPAAAAAPGTNVDVYELNFSIEHNQAWEVLGNNSTLAEMLDGVAGFVYTQPTTNNNVSVSAVSTTL